MVPHGSRITVHTPIQPGATAPTDPSPPAQPPQDGKGRPRPAQSRCATPRELHAPRGQPLNPRSDTASDAKRAGFSHNHLSPSLWTPTRCPAIQLSSDITYEFSQTPQVKGSVPESCPRFGRQAQVLGLPYS